VFSVIISVITFVIKINCGENFMSFDFANEVLDLTNQFRIQNGLGALRLNRELNTAAQAHSQAMAQQDFLAPGQPQQQAKAAGYQSQFLGQNVAGGYKTAQDVVTAWASSPQHRLALMNPNYTDLGVGYYFLANDTGLVNHARYWTQLLGSGDLDASPGAVTPTAAGALRIEAENLQLNGFRVEMRTGVGASGDRYLREGTNNGATATGTFTGPAGIYQVRVGYYDENDGMSQASVTVAGQTTQFRFDQNLPANGTDLSTRTSRVTHSALTLQPGDRFEIFGKADWGEFARFDYIEFQPMALAPLASAPQPLNLGTNLAGIADWSTQYPFLDYFKNSREWITQTDSTWNTQESSKLDLDANGWARSLRGGTFTSISTFIPNDNQGRRFVALYEGEGTIGYRFGAQKISAESRPGRDVFYAKPNDLLNIRILQTDPNGTGNYLRNIRIIPEAHETTATTQLFNPDFLESLKGQDVLRFMDWMETNNSKQQNWNQRPQTTAANFSDEGVPVEVMVALANQTGIDPWFTMPLLATDDYIRNFAQTVKQLLDPRRKIYIELSNETWNSQFSQTGEATRLAKIEFANEPGSDFDKQRLWIGKRTAEMTQIWDQVFGTDKDRVMGVLGAQAGNTYTADKQLEYIRRQGKTYQEVGIDTIAIAPYFGYYLGAPQFASQLQAWTQDTDGGLNRLFQELTTGGVLTGTSSDQRNGALQESYSQMSRYIQYGQTTGLQVIAYEGGQHLAGFQGVENNAAIAQLFVKANRDPRMGQLYRDYLQQWNAVGGGVFTHFNDVGTVSKFGSWSLREALYQPYAPKGTAVQELIHMTDAPTALGTSFRSTNGTITANGLIDLTQVDRNGDGVIDAQVALQFSSILSVAGYSNSVGFYVVANAAGAVRDPLTGRLILPGEAGYAVAALNQRVSNLELNRNSGSSNVTVQGGVLLAPYLIADGTATSWLSQNPTNRQNSGPNAYFAYQAANPDQQIHFQRLDGNRFGFEDFWGGGDRDYDDITFQVSL
jgi:hypothetical protein